MKTVLITGGTGLIGKAILSAALDQAMVVCCVGRRRPDYEHKNLTFIEADFSDEPGHLLTKLPEIDIVIHGAAYIGDDKSADELVLYQKVNIVFADALFRYCRDINVSKVIYISSFSFLQKPLASLIDENHPVAPLTPYAMSKYWGELALFKYADNHYQPVSLRLSSPLPRDYQDLHNTVVKKWIQHALNKRVIEVFGNGNRTQDFISTTDIASAVVNIVLSSNASGIYNIAAGKSLSMKALAEIISNGFKNTKVIFTSNDVNENERWNISIKKARDEINFSPKYSPENAVHELLRSAYEDSNPK